MAEMLLTADSGRQLGSGSSRRLRRQGMVPGVVYGLEDDPVTVSVAYADLREVLSTDAGLNALISLKVGSETQLSIVKEIQRHPWRDEVVHVDFLRVDADQELSVDVPILLEGDARKVTDENGMIDQTLFSLAVLATPLMIPNELVVDISDLEINESLRVRDIVLPDGVRTEVDPDEAVAVGTVTRSTMESIAEEEAAEAAEAAESVGEDGERTGDGGSLASSGDADDAE